MWRPVLEPSSSHQRAKAPGRRGQGWMESRFENMRSYQSPCPCSWGPAWPRRIQQGGVQKDGQLELGQQKHVWLQRGLGRIPPPIHHESPSPLSPKLHLCWTCRQQLCWIVRCPSCFLVHTSSLLNGWKQTEVFFLNNLLPGYKYMDLWISSIYLSLLFKGISLPVISYF